MALLSRRIVLLLFEKIDENGYSKKNKPKEYMLNPNAIMFASGIVYILAHSIAPLFLLRSQRDEANVFLSQALQSATILSIIIFVSAAICAIIKYTFILKNNDGLNHSNQPIPHIEDNKKTDLSFHDWLAYRPPSRKYMSAADQAKSYRENREATTQSN